MEHSHEERAGPTGGVHDSDLAQTGIQVWPQIRLGQGLVGRSLLLGRQGKDLPDFLREMSMPTVKPIVERFEEEHVKPAFKERIPGLSRQAVGFPERPQELHILSQPPLTLDKVEKHHPVEDLEGVVVRPAPVTGLSGKIILENAKESLVFLEELLGDGLNIECLVVALLNGQR